MSVSGHRQAIEECPMFLLLQTTSSFIGGLALVIVLTIILLMVLSYLASRERSKRITRLPRVRGIPRARRREELAIRRRRQV